MKWRESRREAGFYDAAHALCLDVGWADSFSLTDATTQTQHFFLPPALSQCTMTCGQGYQMRAVKCVVGTYMSVVDDNECNAATKPTDTQVNPAVPLSILGSHSPCHQ